MSQKIHLEMKLAMYKTCVIPVLLYSAETWTLQTSNWMPSSFMSMTHPPDKVVWPCLRPKSHQSDRIILHWHIISCRRLSLFFGHVARLDSGVPARDVLECVYAWCIKIRHLLCWRRPPGRPRQTWLHQIGDGSAASIRQEWDLAVGCGHSRRTRSALRASAAEALWWWWCYVIYWLKWVIYRYVYLSSTWLSRLLRVIRRDNMRNETVRGILHQERTLVDRRLFLPIFSTCFCSDGPYECAGQIWSP